jgi:hypothetical protein
LRNFFLIGVLLLVFFSGVSAQEQEESPEAGEFTLEIPDTFFIFPAQEVIEVDNPEIAGAEILDSFENPKGCLIRWYDSNEGLRCRIVILRDNHYIAFDPLAFSQVWSVGSANITRADLNGRGDEEIILHWQNSLGHSGWQGGLSEDWGGILVWDPDSLVRLMDFVDYYRLETWWMEYREWDPEEDTADNSKGHYGEDDLIDSGGDTECDSYNVNFEKGYVEMRHNRRCYEESDEEETQKKAEEEAVIRFKVTDHGLVKEY